MANNKNRREKIGDYELEFIIMPDDGYGNTIKATLFYMGEILVGAQSDRLYETVAEAITDYNTIIIPNYIIGGQYKNTPNIVSVKYLKTAEAIQLFVDKYLLDNYKSITYGLVIDTIEALSMYGIILPEQEDTVLKEEIDRLYKTIDQVSISLKDRLCELGFGADMNTTVMLEHKKVKKHDRCKSLVLTRFPWVGGYRGIANGKTFHADTASDFTRNQDLSLLKKHHEHIFNAVHGIEDGHKDLIKYVHEGYDKSKFSADKDHFETLISYEHSELLKFYRTKRPIRYSNWIRKQKNK